MQFHAAHISNYFVEYTKSYTYVNHFLIVCLVTGQQNNADKVTLECNLIFTKSDKKVYSFLLSCVAILFCRLVERYDIVLVALI